MPQHAPCVFTIVFAHYGPIFAILIPMLNLSPTKQNKMCHNGFPLDFEDKNKTWTRHQYFLFISDWTQIKVNLFIKFKINQNL